MAEEEMSPDFSRPASILGLNIPIAIPIRRKNGRQTYATVFVRVEFDENGEQKATISEGSRNIINRLGEDKSKIFKYIVGIAKATHNTAAAITRKRWQNISIAD